MELKTARLTLLIDPAKKTAFEGLCARQDLTPSQVVRQLIRDYLTRHGVSYVPSGAGRQAGPDRTSRAAPRRPGPRKHASAADQRPMSHLPGRPKVGSFRRAAIARRARLHR